MANELGKKFVYGLSKEGEFGFIDMRFSDKDISDIKGLPNISGERTKWLVPEDLPVDDNSYGILVFEEFNLAPEQVQKTGYQLLRERRIGLHRLSDNWLIIALGNRTEDMAQTYEMAHPLRYRVGHVELESPDVEEWADYMTKKGVDARVVSFLSFRPNLLNPGAKSTDYAFPTPRTWEYVAGFIRGVKDLHKINQYASEWVGLGASAELVAFLKLEQQIDLDSIIANPEQVKRIEQPDILYSLMGVVIEKYREKKVKLQDVLKIANNMQPEFSLLIMKYVQKINPRMASEVQKYPEWKEYIGKFGKYFGIGSEENGNN